MTYNRVVISEAITSTFLTAALFMLFDLLIQGYSNYHNWIITFYVALFGLYYIIAKRYL